MGWEEGEGGKTKAKETQLANFPTGADPTEPPAHSCIWRRLHQGEDRREEAGVAGPESMATSTPICM